MEKISKYLTYEEATKSPTAIRMGITNQPDPVQLENMKFVAREIFDKCREFIKGPLAATSFFRSKELNAAVPGSSTTSQHMNGQAIDLDCDVFQIGKNIEVFDFIRTELIFDQVISEYPDRFGNPAWVHVSKTRTGNRGQVLVRLKDRYIPFEEYRTGMV